MPLTGALATSRSGRDTSSTRAGRSGSASHDSMEEYSLAEARCLAELREEVDNPPSAAARRSQR